MRFLRGYLMLEVGVCGAIAGAILIGLLSQVASARVTSITRHREVTARQIALEVLNETRNKPFALIVAPPADVRINHGAKYTVTAQVSDGGDTLRMRSLEGAPAGSVTTSNLGLAYKQIDVVVGFTTQLGQRWATASTRVYAE